MDKRTVGIIATIATVLICGCPGIFLCIFGGITAAGVMPWTTTINGVSNSGIAPSWVGFVLLCLAVLFVVIPIVVGVLTLRKPKTAAVTTNPGEPLPPAI
jgi:hypothetical protein